MQRIAVWLDTQKQDWTRTFLPTMSLILTWILAIFAVAAPAWGQESNGETVESESPASISAPEISDGTPTNQAPPTSETSNNSSADNNAGEAQDKITSEAQDKITGEAQSTIAGEAQDQDTIIVIGSPMGARDSFFLAGSYDITTRAELEDEHPTDTFELFNKAPGVVLSRYNQGIINTDISIRGFAGDGTTPHAKLFIDGIPSHLHNGYGELDQLFPLGIGSIEVFKGTSDVRHGRFNTAGNYEVRSRTDIATELQATYGTFTGGNFDAFEVQAYSGLEFGGVTQNLVVGYRQSDGFRDNGDVSKYSVSGRWALPLLEDGRLIFMTRLSGYEGDSPGYLTAQESRKANRSTSADYARQDGGEKDIKHFSLHFEQNFFDDAIQFAARAYYQEFQRERWVRFSEEGTLRNRFDDQVQVGLVSTLTWTLLENLSLELGVDVQDEDVIEQRFDTVDNLRLRDTASVRRNLDYGLRTYGAFVSAETSIFDRIRLSAGIRMDSFDGELTDFNAETPEFLDIIDYGLILQPKANIFVRIINGLSIFGNYGRTFQSPFGRSLYGPPNTNEEVSINDGWEAGMKLAPGWGLSLRVSYWEQLASNESVVIDGTPQNVGETQRRGIETAMTWYPLDQIYLWGNFSWVDTEILASNSGPDVPETTGNQLRSIPGYTTSFGGRYDATSNWFVSVHVDGQGSYYVNERNLGGRFGDYLLAFGEIGFHMGGHKVQLQLNNIFDSYFEYVFDFTEDGTSTIHSPGPGFNGNLSYMLSF
ncbi:MAG: TonB-dependent receptor [Myxococcales bacterium]|nr:TonB-dependent receptor [Myxococcales bacterium]